MSSLDHNNLCALFTLGSTCVEYRLEDDLSVSFAFLPTDRMTDRVPKRQNLDAREVNRLPARTPDSLVQLPVRGEGLDLSPPAAFGPGLTMRVDKASSALKFKLQEVIESATGTTVVTVLEAAEGFVAGHFVHWPNDALFIRVWTEFANQSRVPLTLDLLSSFSIAASFGEITGVQLADGALRLAHPAEFMQPDGIFLCQAADEADQPTILNRLIQW